MELSFSAIAINSRKPASSMCDVDSWQNSRVRADLVVLERRVLVHPVRVEHAHVGELGAHALLRHRPQVPYSLDLVDTVVLGLTCSCRKQNRQSDQNLVLMSHGSTTTSRVLRFLGYSRIS